MSSDESSFPDDMNSWTPVDDIPVINDTSGEGNETDSDAELDAFDAPTISETPAIVEYLTQQITGDAIDDRRRNLEAEENIEAGKHYFNGASSDKPAHRHTGSKFFQCPRKTAYQYDNAPKETDDPDGVFYVGTMVEEDVVQPVLKDLVRDLDVYVTNDIGVGFEIETGIQDLYITGYTDPVFIDEDGVPLLVTEVKTTGKDLSSIDEPRKDHLAQAHVYMEGLSRDNERDIRNALIIYINKVSFEVQVFPVAFDWDFWSEMVGWATELTHQRRYGKLPPADPEESWECTYCSYAIRCGQDDPSVGDLGSIGFVPHHEYPEQQVRRYLEAHEDAKLVPSLAHQYPELAEQHGALDWLCRNCEASVKWDVASLASLVCPECGEPELRDPTPKEQRYF